ncbi:MAG TPA: proprotein convertase P-domain-containing protein [Polyangiaceae bacterium]|jgi:subtilisin-like proprotein convertase family protein/C1A family cysteine protease|nr:MAG: Calcium-dependent protease precursor [Deltaproteobacteria bacterium ADurb.Bin207]HNT00325.1 proprotein convertase P-domain-containing protein [Polyangiaceae bacterium]HNZ23456.1 proprotein convertase P-domain-containing protein [Polyangiaceae bacterium]HOD25742.1 proprotein convertase P-domain-containing protein [Polyangiaceae bacterium]HOE51749.1 proprotein convertase P-domain-containing protein [Polyangiaceae bacterium]
MTESQKAKGLTREMQRDRFGCVEQRGSDGKGALKRDRLEGRTKRMLTHRLQDKPWMKYVSTGILLASASLWAACSSDEGSVDKRSEVTNEDGDAPLSNLDDLTAGAPSKADLPEEGKADAVYPPTYFDLVKLQSPVKSQGSRGVCSIFASTAHMEHLYIAEGTIKTPDFSEQFLQWSVKNEVKAFRNTEGSSASENLRAIYQFGIVEEAAWPYESTKWSSYNHPECSGEDSLPTECYTNGNPPEAAMGAKRWRIPQGRWINSNERSIKAHMFSKKTAVEVGGTFYYQAWNHRGSPLPTNNAYWRKGYVTYPNDVDKQKSLEKRAGHGFLLVGWDDTLEVQKRDGDGKLLTDSQGNPLMEKGFFIFKNSWGKGSFGVDNPHGDGYGYISYKYVAELNAYVSGLPKIELPKEVCNDGEDNDMDGKTDCDDPDCAQDPSCVGSTQVFSGTGGAIPDNDPKGLTSSIVVAKGGTISAMSVAVDITHTYSGDITIKLVREGGGEVVLQDRDGGSEHNIKRVFGISDFNGQDAVGTWKLVVIDNAKLDTGTLNGWTLSITDCVGNDCASGAKTYSNTESKPIDDGSSTGVFSNIVVDDEGEISAMKVFVDITHPEQIDLTIKLQRVGVPGEAILQEAASADGPYVPRSYNVSNFLGQDAKGTWRLVVVDEAAGDSGTLNGWSLEIAR